MVQTSLKHQEKPSEYWIYSPLLHIMTNRPPCRYIQGMVQYWEMRGQRGDMWIECPALDTRWYEDNCTVQPGLDIAIWEPCNYVSNLAYDR